MQIRASLPGWLVLVFGLWSAPAAADTWPLPADKTYASDNAMFRLVVEPGSLSGERRAPSGSLEKRSRDGGWRRIWARPLVNLHAPVSAIVANAGDFVVTFDNWHSLGHGDDVVVVYDARGGVVASLALDDFLPSDIVQALPRSSSSIWWGGEHQFNDVGDAVMLEVAVPELRGIPRAERHFRVRLDLASGKTTVVRNMDWIYARAAAGRINAMQARQRQEFEAPLVAPAVNSRRAWQAYARDVHARLDPAWPPSDYEPLVLRMPPDADYMGDVRSIRGMLGFSRLAGWRASDGRRQSWREAPTAFVFASPATGVLADALVQEAATLRFGSLAGWRVYVTCGPRDHGRLRLTLARLGAEFIPIGLDQPIPQRPERLRNDG